MMSKFRIALLFALLYIPVSLCHSRPAVPATVETVDSVLIIPAGIEEIEESAFLRRQDIREIRFEGKKLRKIGRGAFAWCGNLRRVEFPAGLEDIGPQAFAYCTALAEVQFPSTLKHIGANAFSFCSSLQYLFLPPRIHELESYAFCECSALKEVTLPGNSSMLGEMIFSGCTELQSVSIDSSTPPSFECNSQLFDPDETFLYLRCRLHVPAAAIGLYRQAEGWNLFRDIRPL